MDLPLSGACSVSCIELTCTSLSHVYAQYPNATIVMSHHFLSLTLRCKQCIIIINKLLLLFFFNLFFLQ